MDVVPLMKSLENRPWLQQIKFDQILSKYRRHIDKIVILLQIHKHFGYEIEYQKPFRIPDIEDRVVIDALPFV